MIYVTHDQEEALSIADRVAVMRDGQSDKSVRPGKSIRTQRPVSLPNCGNIQLHSATKKNGKIQFGQREFVVADLADVAGEAIHLAIRPEKIEFVTPPLSSEQYVASNVVDVVAEVITFLGAVVRITFVLEGKEMDVDLPEKAFEKTGLQRGKKFTLYFPPEAFHVYTEFFKKSFR